MRIGLLECDHVRDEFRHLTGDYRDLFPALFSTVVPDWEFVNFDVVNGHFPATALECDAYLATGSRFSVYDDEPWIHRLKAFIRTLLEARKPYLGVCFGHQLLAEALGGRVAKAAQGWGVGVHTFETIKAEPWMQPPSTHVNLLMMCQDQVQELPPQARVLARSAHCPVAMFQVADSMLGIQAHPEFNVDYEAALMRSRVERIGAETVQAGLESLAYRIDATMTAAWMARFVERALLPS